MKKLTNEQRIKEALNKKYNIPEGIIDTIFKRALASKIKGDPELQKLAKDLDSAYSNLRAKAEERKRQGKPIPSAWQHLLQ